MIYSNNLRKKKLRQTNKQKKKNKIKKKKTSYSREQTHTDKVARLSQQMEHIMGKPHEFSEGVLKNNTLRRYSISLQEDKKDKRFKGMTDGHVVIHHPPGIQ